MTEKGGTRADGLGEERQHVAEQMELALGLVGHLCALHQALRLYDLSNDRVREVLEDILQTTTRFGQLTGEGMTLAIVNYSVFINRRLVRMDFNQYRKAQQLMVLWSPLEIGEIAFERQMSLEGLMTLAQRFIDVVKDPTMSPALFLKPWGGVRLTRYEAEEDSAQERDLRAFSIRVFCALQVLVRRMLADLSAGRRLPMLRIKRALQVMVDLLEEHQHLVLALIREPEFKRDLASHLVNTTTLALMMGRRLALSRAEIISLGTAALFHDLPKLGLKEATLNSLEHPETIPEADRARVEARWLSSVQAMAERGGFSDEMLARLVVIYESQMEFSRLDLYADAQGRGGHCLYSRIISLGSRLDTITWDREGKRKRTAHWAMLALLSSIDIAEDVPLALMMLEIVGLYPTGSLVLLNTGEIGVVKRARNMQLQESPTVRLVVDPQGNSIEGPDVDLAADPHRHLQWPLNPEPLQVNPVLCF